MSNMLRSHSGFSLVEMLVSAAIMLIVFAMASTAFFQTRKISKRNYMDVEILQHARIGMDEIARSLKMIGYQRDKVHGQVALIEAAPFQLIFNANMDADEIPSEREEALPPESIFKLYDATEYLTPLQNYTTGAETIHWTLDTYPRPYSQVDGLVDEHDINDNTEEQLTVFNPNDMVLIKRVNFGTPQQIALGLLGPYDAEGEPTNVLPMFQYRFFESISNIMNISTFCRDRFSSYSTFSPYSSFYLLGDTNCDQQLDGDERYFPSVTSQTLLRNLRRIEITLTVESDHKDPFNSTTHRQISLSTQVGLRNME